MNRNTL